MYPFASSQAFRLSTEPLDKYFTQKTRSEPTIVFVMGSRYQNPCLIMLKCLNFLIHISCPPSVLSSWFEPMKRLWNHHTTSVVFKFYLYKINTKAYIAIYCYEHDMDDGDFMDPSITDYRSFYNRFYGSFCYHHRRGWLLHEHLKLNYVMALR